MVCAIRRADEGEVRQPLLHGLVASLPGPFLSLFPGFSSLGPDFVSFVAGILSLGPGIFLLGPGLSTPSGYQDGKNGQYEYKNSDCQSASNNRPCVQIHMSPSACKVPLGITVTGYHASRRFPSMVLVPRSVIRLRLRHQLRRKLPSPMLIGNAQREGRSSRRGVPTAPFPPASGSSAAT